MVRRWKRALEYQLKLHVKCKHLLLTGARPLRHEETKWMKEKISTLPYAQNENKDPTDPFAEQDGT